MAEMSEVDLDALVVQVEGLGLEENKVGSGAYGIVFKVTVNGKKCIAKKLHNILLQADNYYPHAPTQQREFIVRKFRNECCILKSLDDPNVVSFEGIHYGHDKNDISLIMERLHSDLADFVKKNPSTNLATRIHILYDVSKGLRYLHSLTPPLIHRDLTAPNILLTEDLTAKIGDLGVSRYVDPTVPTILSTNPGHLIYMSPESQVENPIYTTKLDIFSFGNLIIHTVIGDLPKVYTILSTDPNKTQYEREGKMELMRRNTSVHVQMGENHALYPLAVCCLHDRPKQRPAVEEVSSSLRELCHRHPRMSFLEACKAGIVGVVQELLDGGADPNQADENNETAVCWASRNGHDEVVRVLIRAGANVNTPIKKNGGTAVMAAAQNGHCEVVRMLLEAKADINIKANDNQTALHRASDKGHDEVVGVLLAAKAAVNTQTKTGESPLYLASFDGHQKCVQLLLEAGAIVDVQRDDGCTALMAAAQNGHCEVVRMLLEAKADVNSKTNVGQSAYNLARKNGHTQVCELLQPNQCNVM